MSDLLLDKLPRHLAIIMDGNGRWAQARGMKRLDGHRAGAESVRVITRTARELGIDYLTLYAFSEENWQRPKPEVTGLMQLLHRYLSNELKELTRNDIRLNAIGDLDRLPKSTGKLLRENMEKTAGHSSMVLTLALSYGGRPEILRACRRLAEQCKHGEITADDITEDIFSQNLYTSGLPDPDLLIRTGGEHRVSNFLLWQIAYSELYITNLAWPDFREEQLKNALVDYQSRQRRFGKTGEQVAQES